MSSTIAERIQWKEKKTMLKEAYITVSNAEFKDKRLKGSRKSSQ